IPTVSTEPANDAIPAGHVFPVKFRPDAKRALPTNRADVGRSSATLTPGDWRDRRVSDDFARSPRPGKVTATGCAHDPVLREPGRLRPPRCGRAIARLRRPGQATPQNCSR